MKLVRLGLLSLVAAAGFSGLAQAQGACSQSYADADSCNSDPSCYWWGAMNVCENRAGDCSVYGNQYACDNDPNCSWSGPYPGGQCESR